MRFRLLVDLEVFEFIKTLSRTEQGLLYRRFRQIQESPTAFADYHEYANAGYRVEINICDRFAISFAVDHQKGSVNGIGRFAPFRPPADS